MASPKQVAYDSTASVMLERDPDPDASEAFRRTLERESRAFGESLARNLLDTIWEQVTAHAERGAPVQIDPREATNAAIQYLQKRSAPPRSGGPDSSVL